MTREDYSSHTEADAGLWAAAHAEPDDDRPTLADVADAERDTVHVCSGYCAAFEAAHPGHTGLTILSAAFGHVCFQVGDGPECTASAEDLRQAKAVLDVPVTLDRVRVDGDWLDESDVDYLLDVATRSQEAS